MARKLVLTIGWRPQFLAVWTFPWGCLSVLMIWQLASPRLNDERARKRHGAFYDLVLGVMLREGKELGSAF